MGFLRAMARGMLNVIADGVEIVNGTLVPAPAPVLDEQDQEEACPKSERGEEAVDDQPAEAAYPE